MKATFLPIAVSALLSMGLYYSEWQAVPVWEGAFWVIVLPVTYLNWANLKAWGNITDNSSFIVPTVSMSFRSNKNTSGKGIQLQSSGAEIETDSSISVVII